MAAESDMTYEEAQEAMEDGDTVTASELMEMYPDKTMNQINYDMAKEQADVELQSKLQEKYEFNEPRMRARQGRKTYHTGPKGVLTDYEEAKLNMRALRIDDKIKRTKNKNYMSLDNGANETQFKQQIIDMKKAKPTQKELRREHKSEDLDNDVDSDDLLEDLDDDLDEEAMRQYKMQKLRIMEENRPRYGDTKEVTAWTFEKEVDGAPTNVWVVIHVYQDYMERCGRMNYALAQVAKSYPHIKFLRARSDRLGLDTYPEVGLPTFICFKNGKQLQNHIAVHELIGNPFDVKDVEAFLIKNKVIEPVVVIDDPNDKENDNDGKGNNNSNKKSKISMKTNGGGSKFGSKFAEDSDSELDID